MRHARLPSGETSITMLFYLAVPSPPAPTEDGVFLQTVPGGLSTLVRPFTSFLWTSPLSYSYQLWRLQSDVNAAGESYMDDAHFRVSYSGPSEWIKYNEVWVDVPYE